MMSTTTAPTKRKGRPNRTPSPLGVLEFSSALNGDDVLVILRKLRRFVDVTGYERRLALGGFGAHQLLHDDDDDEDRDGGAPSDDDDASLLSFDDEEENEDEDDNDDARAGPSSSKRRKSDAGGAIIIDDKKKKTPGWKLDKKGYRVPFVGTSVSKGDTGSVTPDAWPTGFLEAYGRHSPSGTELVGNEYVSALPPGGVHKALLRDESGSGSGFGPGEDPGGGGKRRKGGADRGAGQTRGQITSMALQTNYWLALSEWILGFAPVDRAKRELGWEEGALSSMENEGAIDGRSDKCAVPPPVMTVLMKQRLPEWVDAVHNYAHLQHQQAQRDQKERQQKKKQKKMQQHQQQKQPEEDQKLQRELQQQQDLKLEKRRRQVRKRQRREEALLLSAMRNLIALCHLSDGTAREVLRRLTAPGTGGGGGGVANRDAKGGKFGGRGSKALGGGGPGGGEGASWMVQMFQQRRGDAVSSSSSASAATHGPQAEFLRLACALLETNDRAVLSRATEVAAARPVKQGGGKHGKGGGGGRPHGGERNAGLACVALRYGIQRLLDIRRTDSKSVGKEVEDEDDDVKEQIDVYSRYATRLLRDILNIFIPPATTGNQPDGGNGAIGSNEGFVLGVDATAELLSGAVLENLTQLSLSAPPFDATTESIQAIIDGNDAHEDLNSIELASVEARRLLFLMLIDTHRSPFLRSIHQSTSTGESAKTEDQSTLYLSQLAKALHGVLANHGYGISMKMFLGMCLKSTPELVPHFFRGLQLSDPRPTYRSLAALTFVDGVLQETPSPPSISPDAHASATERTLSTIIPPCVTKTLLGKVIQSPSALLVSSGLKLIITLLRRAHDCISTSIAHAAGSSSSSALDQWKLSVSRTVAGHLPEASLLLSIPSRFDPFEHGTNYTTRVNALVVLQLCEALQCYARLDPSLMKNVKFDWSRLVPYEILSSSQTHEQVRGRRIFFSAEPLLQRRILQTLLVTAHLSQTPFSSKMLPNALSILVSTKIPEVYKMARKLALSLIEREIVSQMKPSPDNAEVVQCHKYESSLWVDGMSVQCIQELVTMIDESKQQRVQHKIRILQAWEDASLGYAMPSLGISSLLSSSIVLLLRREADFSIDVSLLLVQIATKMLFFQANPKPLAAIIVFSAPDSVPSDRHLASLYRVAKNILKKDPNTHASIKSLVSNLFLPECNLNFIVQVTNAGQNSKCTQQSLSGHINPTSMRQCLSMMKYSEGENEGLYLLVCKIMIGILQTGESAPDIISRLAAMLKSHFLKPPDRENIIMILLSAARTNQCRSGVMALLEYDGKVNPSSIGMGLVSELLQCSLVPANHSNALITDLWKNCSSALQSSDARVSSLKDFLLMLLLHTMPAEEDSDSPFRFPPDVIFDLWALVARNTATKLASELGTRLEDRLTTLFDSMDGQGTWAVYQRVCDITPQVFVDLCLNSLLQRDKFTNGSECTLLPSFLEYDCSGFSCLSSLFSSIDTDTKMLNLWKSGRLDLVAATFALQALKQKCTNRVAFTEPFSEAARMIGRRFLHLLSRNPEMAAAEVGSCLILELLKTLCSHKFILLETQQTMLTLFGCLEKGSMTFTISDEIELMNLAICVGSSHENRESTPSLLLTNAFIRCCKVLPKHIKKMMRTRQKAESTTVESLLQNLSLFVESPCSFDKVTVEDNAKVVDTCVIACLKYGMMDSKGLASCSILGGCLKIIRMFASQSQTTQIALGSLAPSQVHAMAISHSSFQSALSSGGSGFQNDNRPEFFLGVTQQLELTRLLLCTLSLDSKKIKIESEIWTTLLSVYNASTSVSDQLLRRLMFLYEQNGCCKHEIMMSDLQWGPSAKNHSSLKEHNQVSNDREDESWEWFLDALELDRIRSTLSQYPVAEMLEPAPYNDIECATVSGGKDQQPEPPADSEDESDDDTIGEAGPTVTLQSNTHWSNDLWRGGGDDLRYSPGFVLPLIMATLEAHIPNEPSNDNVGNESHKITDEMRADEEIAPKPEEEIGQSLLFGYISRRVCDKGGIALAIASLSSRCPSIRKLAVSICALFLKALQMVESHGIKSWHERPQQEMVISSIQRGLAVRRAIQIERYEAQGGIELGGMVADVRKYNIPMLPAVSAVFLAKVLLIVSNPRDDMYGQMNRYFLRLADYHGAFQDCFGLPAFLSLYCSASDELSRCRTERNWALLTLKDSAVDDFCYRIISQHHVPELLMSSFDSLVDNPESKSELYLTIDVIESLIHSGGTRASLHLIKRQGLLSWLHGAISWRKVSSVFPFDALKCKFLKLVITAVSSYRSSKDAVVPAFYEKVPLANAVIRICLDGADANEDEEVNPSLEYSTQLLTLTCNALWEICLADKESQTVRTNQGLTPLHDAVSLLVKFVHYEDMFEKVLASLCDLPLVMNDDDMPAAKTFCELALASILKMRVKLNPDMIVLSLYRVHELLKEYPCLLDNDSIISQVLECRHLAILNGGMDAWHGCMGSLLSMSGKCYLMP